MCIEIFNIDLIFLKGAQSSEPLNTKIPPIPYFFGGRLVWNFYSYWQALEKLRQNAAQSVLQTLEPQTVL
jgi:hypothetical protein